MTGPSRGARAAGTAPGTAHREHTALAVLATCSFVVVLDYAGAIILLPSIQAELGGGLDLLTWVVAAFLLPFAVLLPPSARLTSRGGARGWLVTGLALFALASAAAALSPSLGVLLGARVVQGAGAAVVEPAVYTLLRTAIPVAHWQRALNAQAAAFLLGGALGPFLPGVLATVLSWRYLFVLNLLLGVVLVAAALRALPASPRARGRPSLDTPGVLLAAGWLFLLFFGVIEGHRLGWASAPIVGALASCLLLSGVWLAVESRATRPLLDLALFRVRRFAVGNLVRAATEFASLGIFLPLSHFLQVQRGYSAMATGLLLMSVIGGALLSAPVAEPLAARVDVRWLVLPGFLVLAVGTLWAAHVTADTTWTFLVGPLAVAGLGIGALEGPTDRTVRRAVPPGRERDAWAVSYVAYLLGIGAGVVVVSAVWQSRVTADPAGAVNTALLGCVAAAAAGALVGTVLSSGGSRPRRQA